MDEVFQSASITDSTKDRTAPARLFVLDQHQFVAMPVCIPQTHRRHFIQTAAVKGSNASTPASSSASTARRRSHERLSLPHLCAANLPAVARLRCHGGSTAGHLVKAHFQPQCFCSVYVMEPVSFQLVTDTTAETSDLLNASFPAALAAQIRMRRFVILLSDTSS